MSTDASSTENPSTRLFQLLWPGALAAQAVSVAARLRLADLLGDAPMTAEALATRAGVHAPSLERLLRALTSFGVFREDDDGRFHHTDMSATMRTDRQDSTHAWATFLGAPFLWSAWGDMLETVRTGETAFDRVHGAPFYEYVAAHPSDAATYDNAMSRGSTRAAHELIAAYDFGRFDLIVDVGGGQGALLHGILDANPRVRGILFDFPAVVEGARVLRQGAVAERARIVAGNAFHSVPEGGDAYILKSVIHSLDDDAAVRVLENCRLAMRPDGRLLLVEIVLSPRREPDPGKALMDLMMLTLVAGRERTHAEFETLLARAGFRLEQVVAMGNGSSIVEASVAHAPSTE
jgi:hypothetical protein